MLTLRFIGCLAGLAFAGHAWAAIVPAASASMAAEAVRARLAQAAEAPGSVVQGAGAAASKPLPSDAGPLGGETDVAARPPADAICEAIASAAARNDLPLAFFTRLIWQESRFDPAALSPKGARGIAQFMPATATGRGLRNPFDPVEAIPKAAELLAELGREFGNLGLAAAAYNAGPRRVREWLAGRQALPRETQAYVRLVTGRPAEQWVAAASATSDMPPDIPCRPVGQQLATARPSSAKPAPASPGFVWGVQLIGGPSEALALAAWRQLQQRYPLILGGQEPVLIRTRLGPRGASWHRVRIGAITLASANALCGRLRGAGASCLVQRN
jgi:Transglycosylase SLT domain/SPOR domain